MFRSPRAICRAQRVHGRSDQPRVPAMVLSRRIEDLGKQYGRDFIREISSIRQAPFVTPTTTLVTIFAGANDVDTIVASLGGGAGGSDQMGYINSQMQAFAQEFAIADTTRPRQGVRRPRRGPEPAEHGGHAERCQCVSSTAPGRTAVVGRHQHSGHQPSGRRAAWSSSI